ncbi:uncharacterized protein LOC114732899 [Neltuma alba]|uniref:uncharacterized protein LOC114732899 n=1 Tax=Neltuma alba TaxID=207710 RepID=UPI0010A3202D|nr:uncharacterized protein LOC114732899 [Prosopis alba]
MELGNLIGKALKFDMNTLVHCDKQRTFVERGKFTRVSVEVDLTKPLQSRFIIRKRIFTVAYEGPKVICFQCGKYDHKKEECSLARTTQSGTMENNPPKKKMQSPKNTTKATQPLVNVPGVTYKEQYGEWMVTQKTFRQRLGRREAKRRNANIPAGVNKSTASDKKKTTGTQFEVLQEEMIETPTMASSTTNKKKEPAKEWRKKAGKEPSTEEARERLQNQQHMNRSYFVFGETSMRGTEILGMKELANKCDEEREKLGDNKKGLTKENKQGNAQIKSPQKE